MLIFLLFSHILLSQSLRVLSLKIDVKTTSDWVRISPFKPLIIDSARVETDAEEVKDLFFCIAKKSYDTSFTHATYYVSVPAGEDIGFEVRKGYIGYSVLDISCGEHTLLTDRLNTGMTRDSLEVSLKAAKDVCNLEPLYLKYERVLERPLLLAFYYAWYGNPAHSGRWFHWDKSGKNVAGHPLYGFYDSQDTIIILRHIEMAQSSGIDGFVVSWWDVDSEDGKFIDDAFSKLLASAEEKDFGVSLILEKAKNEQDFERQIKYIIERYGGSSSFIKLDGRYLIFLYRRLLSCISPDYLNFIAKKYSVSFIVEQDLRFVKKSKGLFFYVPDFSEEKRFVQNQTFMMTARHNGDYFVLSVIPGFKKVSSGAKGSVVSRENGELYRRLLSEAIRLKPDILLITSFNEWHEGTQIEPAEEYGDLYLKITREYSRIFHGGDQ
ncbi:MAG TPA: hypothetical protein ENG51_10295 [Deltaproteobacteria bacterium]|nr:hypothetical protein [Deltaproteobacteria bacterium]